MRPYEDIANAFRTKHIMTSWKEVLAIPGDRKAGAAKDPLASHGFYFAPCVSDGDVIGIVDLINLQTANPEDKSRNVMRPLRSSDLVESEAPIADLLAWMTISPFYIVLSGNQPVGIVHRSDTDKQPVRSYFYLLLSDLEMGLVELLNRSTTDDSWRKFVSTRHLREAERKVGQAQRKGLDLNLFHYLYLSDFLEILHGKRQGLSRLGIRLHDLEQAAAAILRLRKLVAHPTRHILDEFTTPELLEVNHALQGLIGK